MQQTSLHESPFDSQNTEHEQVRETGLNRGDLNTLVNEGVVTRNPSVVSGSFVFAGTRVPIYNLWDYLLAGDSLDDFLDSFPTVPRSIAEKAMGVVILRASNNRVSTLAALVPQVEAVLLSLQPGYVYRVELPDHPT